MATAKNHKRHDFSKTVKDELAKRVAYRCSMPGCDIATVGPRSGGGSTNDGTAAHITAASEEGPRYDKSISEEQRRSIENGIWMCANHGRQIDSNEGDFRADDLQRWKQEAEERARRRVLQRQPRETDSIELLKQVSTAQGAMFIPYAFRNTAAATKMALRNLDSRLEIDTSFVNGRTSYTIKSVDTPVKFTLRVKSTKSAASSIDLGWQNLIENGDEWTMKDVSIEMEGSEAVNAIMRGDLVGNLTFGSVARNGTIKIKCRDEITNSELKLPSISAVITHGEKNARITGSLYDGLISVSILFPIDQNSRSATLTLSIDVTSWEGEDVRHLRDFDDIYEFFTKCTLGWGLSVDAFEHGRKLFDTNRCVLGGKESIQRAYRFLDYLSQVRIILNHVSRSVNFSSNFSVPYKDVEHVKAVADEVSKIGKSVPGLRAIMEIDLNEQLLFKYDEDIEFPAVWCHHRAVAINVLGIIVPIPDFLYCITNVLLRITQSDNAATCFITGTAESYLSLSDDCHFESNAITDEQCRTFFLPR